MLLLSYHFIDTADLSIQSADVVARFGRPLLLPTFIVY